MSAISDPKLKGIDFERSFLLGVIYDDESLTLEMDFRLTESHPEYSTPPAGEDGCYRGGFVRFADIDDLQIDKTHADDKEVDYSIIYAVSGDGRNFQISSGWGDIKVVARSVRVQLD